MNETALPETAHVVTDALWPSLHSPQWLWLLPLVLAAFGLLLLVARQGRGKALATFAAPRLLGTLLASVSRTRRILKSVLVLIGAALIVLAVARPQYGFRWSESRSRGIDIVFVLDTSRSMLATDIKPDRLQRAKLAILDFVDQLDGDRIGLVAFAGDAFVQCPLTLDYNVFEQSLEAINTDTIPVGGTNFAKAITVAEDAFAKDNNHKILVMLTDGEDLEGQGLKRAKEAAKNGVTIFTVGVGTAEGSLIPVTDRFGRRDFLRDDSGQQVMTRLESDTLNDIAEVTGGFYAPLGNAGQGLQTVYRDGLQSFEKQELSSQMKREGIDRFQWPLGLAIILLAWEPLISNRKAAARRAFNLFRRNSASAQKADHAHTPEANAQSRTAAPRSGAATLAALLLPALLALSALHPAKASADETATQDKPDNTRTQTTATPRSAEALFAKGDFATAEEAFSQLLNTDKADPRLRYNFANTLLAQKQYEAATKAYAQVLADADITLQADAFYNLGLAHYGRGTQAFEGSDPAQTLAQSEQARRASAAATQTGQQLLDEAARMQALSRPPTPPLAAPSAQELSQQPELPQEAVKQAIQLAEQAKQASETALESGDAFIEKAQAASGFWRRAQADFNSAAELSTGNAADARHNAEQTLKSVDALSARISQTQRANRAHEADTQSLEKLIEELKKLLKEPPQDDQNQQDQDQQNQDQNQQNQQNQDQQNQDQQSQDQQNGQQDQQQSGDSDQQQQQQSGQDSQSSENNKQEQNPQDQQGDQQDQQNQDQQNGQQNQQQNQQERDGSDKQQAADSNEGDKQEQNQQQDGQQQPQDNQQQQGADNQQQQGQPEGNPQQNDNQQQGERSGEQSEREQDGREQTDGQQPVDLTDEQREQMAAGEQPMQDQPTGAQQEAAVQRAGAMSQQEAAGLIDSLNNSGKLLPLSGRGQQQQYTRPSRDW